MKKIYLNSFLKHFLLLAFILVVNQLYSQTTSIPDANFEQALIGKGIDSDGIINGQVLTSDISGVKELSVYSLGIYELTGIEDFVSLTELYCDHNYLTALDVSNNKNLEKLVCYSNRISDLKINGAVLLKELYCGENQLTSLDVSQNSVLEYLRCDRGNKITNLDLNNPNLKYLVITSNELSNIDLSSCENLETLLCSFNKLSSIDVSNNSKLHNFNCAGNNISTIDVSNNLELYQFYCSTNQITTIDITNNTSLIELGIGINNINEIDLSNNPKLQSLECSETNITDLDLSKLAELRSLYCQDNTLTSLNVKNGNNSVLTTFNAINNPGLTCIQVDNETAANAGQEPYSTWQTDATTIYSENCSYFGLTYVPDDVFEKYLIDNGYDEGPLDNYVNTYRISSVTDVVIGAIGVVDLTGIEDFTNLERLNCWDSQLTELDVSQNTALKSLTCQSNLLTELDVSQNTALTYLSCHSNQLTELDVSQNTALTYLSCENNQLTCIQVDDETAANDGLYPYNAWEKDATATYSEDCSTFGKTYVPDDNFEQALIDLGYDDVLDDYVVTDNISGLKNLSVRDKKILDLSGLQDFLEIESLDCSFNFLTSIDLESNVQLKTLNCRDNALNKIDLSKNINLVSLQAGYNALQEIILGNHNNFESLGFWSNQVESINLSGLPNLKFLNIGSNKIREIDLSQNINLDHIECIENEFEYLDFSKNVKLEYISCYWNNLIELDLRKNINLNELNAFGNNLIKLNLKNGKNEFLKDVNVKNNNNLTCIEVDNEEEANSGIGVYGKWIVDATSTYSENCSNGQSKITMVTNSDFSAWNLAISNPSVLLDWTATGAEIGAINMSLTNTPTFDFSANTGFSDITVETNGTPENFAGISFLQAVNGVGSKIKSIDLSDLPNLEILRLADNVLTTIDLTNNPNLIELNINRNDLSTLELSNNPVLEELEVDANVNLFSLDLSNNPKLETLSASSLMAITTLDISNNPELDNINLAFTPLTTATIDAILKDLDGFGKSNGFLNVQNTSGSVSIDGIDAYSSLVNKGWTIIPPVFFDFGDAPDSYGTLLSSGGAQHIIGDGDLNLGTVYDDESDGFPSANADGDDLNNVADEDGVDPLDLVGISTSTDVLSVDVDYTNNTTSGSNIYVWIDFDRSGTFDVDEFTTSPIPSNSTGTATLTWSDLIANGVDIVEGDTFARFRVTSDVLTGANPGGIVNNGEVEDYFLVILLDTDKDGVPDSSDLDADNDGILNTDEAGDTNGNGIDDIFELDSDSDGCFDTLEAGVLDGDADGIVGTGVITNANVDADGLVISDVNGSIVPGAGNDAYGPLNDLNSNGVYDFQEVGTAASITTEPVDQDFDLGGMATFAAVAIADNYQWEVSIDGGTTWTPVANDANNAGANTNTLTVSNLTIDVYKNRYQLVAEYVSFVCDISPVISIEVGFNRLDDFDGDTVPDVFDVDDDNDGIFDTVEDSGIDDRDTDLDGFPDRLDLDADGDGCFDVNEAGFTDNGSGMLGTSNPPDVDATGQVTSATDGYTAPNDLDASGTPDFQEEGTAAAITTQPTDQKLFAGDPATFTIVAIADIYNWQESTDGGSNWNTLSNGGNYSGADTASLTILSTDNSMINYEYRVMVNNIAYACDPTTTSDAVTFYQTLGVEDQKLDKSIKFYPNPVSNTLSIKTETIIIEKVEIYSYLGVKLDEVDSGFEHIQTDNLSKGIYIIKIYSEKGSATRRLIKQ